jgi:pimeloyl-ACP methyl ester carboxylesterase
MRRRVILGLCLLLLLASSNYTAQAQTSVPRYESAKCPFKVPRGQNVTCGYLIVPEDRSDPQSRTIKIAVAVFNAQNKTEDDPVIYLDGGPGGHSLETASLSFEAAFAGFARNRDFVMFDQRGVGYSQPNLDCPEETTAAYDGLTKRMTYEQKSDLIDQAIQTCHDRLVAQGVNLSAYNSAANAADVNDLRAALGYKEWNLYGISYGTRLALTIMRDFPDGIRSVVLDSTVPPQIDLFGKIPANADRAFKIFFTGCLKNRACNKAYPNLDKTFYNLVTTLNENPASITAKQPYTGKKFKLLIDGHDFVDMLFGSLYSNQVIVYLPKIISDASKGKYQLLEQFMAGSLVKHEYLSIGMYYSVQCAEEVSFNTLDSLEGAIKKFPKLADAFDMTQYYERCQMWGVKPAPAIENKAVTSPIQTLVMSGTYDPITPPSYGWQAAQTLKHSFYFEFPGVGHGASVSDICPYMVAIAFVENPLVRPEIGCISGMTEPSFIS